MSKRPRSKKVRECPNPLYLKWLEEWRDEARDQGSKMQHTYAKAISSLKKYPLPLSCGEDAKILDGIGTSIARKLDEASKNIGLCADEEPFYRTHAVVSADNVEDHYAALHVSPPNTPNEDLATAAQQPKQAKRQKKTRKYVPAYRSGAYALLVTLYRKSQQRDYRGYMSKPELQREAQPLSETSLTLPDPGTQYTAWSSMSTLTRKGYVLKRSSPAKYSITDSGCELAQKLEMASDSHQTSSSSHPIIAGAGTHRHQPVPPSSCSSLGSSTSASFTAVETESPVTVEPDFSLWETDVRPTPPERLQYWYVNEGGKCVTRKDQALVTVDDIVCPGFLIKCREDALKKSSLKYSIDKGRQREGQYVYAYLQDGDAAERCTAGGAEISTIAGDGGSDDELLRPVGLTASDPACSFTRVTQTRDFTKIKGLIPKNQPGNVTVCDDDDSEIDERMVPREKVNFIPEFVLRPGTFDIVLCVDNVETIGGASNSRKKELLPDLQSNGVMFDVRKLHVGDFLWVAREKPNSNQLSGQRHLIPPLELVLDYVVERKRMDDLCSSIIDGRFKEQKFRLRRSGVQHPIYLVEDFGSTQHMSIPETTIQQAIVNTQVIDGFTVKRTSNMKESVAYLTIMTRYLQSLYSDKTLRCCPRESVEQLYDNKDRFSKLYSSEVFLMSFPEFNESTVKNRVMTVSEVFAKQLMQIGGVSADKTVAILEKYPTPSSLLRAYRALPTEKDRELMLATLKPSKSQRNFGPALSKVVSQLYCSKGPLR